jgi:hypothetical protein
MSDVTSSFEESVTSLKGRVAAGAASLAFLASCAMTPDQKPQAFRACEQYADNKVKQEKEAAEAVAKKKESAAVAAGEPASDGWKKKLSEASRTTTTAIGAGAGYLLGIGAAGGAVIGFTAGGYGDEQKHNKWFKECMDTRYAGGGAPKSYEQRNVVPVEVKEAPRRKSKSGPRVEASPVEGPSAVVN